MRRSLSSQSPVPIADLDEVAQEVFVRLSRYNDDVLIESPQSFVLRIAANVVDELREHSANDSAKDIIEAIQERASESLARKAVAAHLRAEIDKLPPRQRQVLLMHIDQDLTYKQIAITLNLAPRIVRRDLARAYAHLRSGLSTAELSEVCDL